MEWPITGGSLWTAVIGTFGGLSVGLVLDTIFYYRQPQIYDKFFHWWYALSEIKFKELNRGIMSLLLVADIRLFGIKLLSWEVFGIQLAVLMDFSAVGLRVAGVRAPFFQMLAWDLVISLILLPPALVAFYVSRRCIRHAAMRASARSLTACLSANLLTIFGMLLALDLVSVVLFMYAIHIGFQYGLSDFDSLDLSMFIGACIANYKMMLLRIAMVPIYFYTSIGFGIFVLFLSAKFFERALAREVEGKRYQAFTALGTILGATGAVLFTILQPLISAGYTSFDRSQTIILTKCSVLGTQALLSLYPIPDRQKLGAYAWKLGRSEVTESLDNIYPDAMTGLAVSARLGFGLIRKDDTPTRRYYADIDGCWLGRNDKQLLAAIQARLKDDPDDVWALYLEDSYYISVEIDAAKAQAVASHLKSVVYAKSSDPRVRAIADNVVRATSALPQDAHYLPSSTLQNFMRGKFTTFPGNQIGLALWLIVTRQVSLPPLSSPTTSPPTTSTDSHHAP